MPSRLKSLELQGYKTFASKTLFAFSDTVTAIIGPNGSGKSNIADSIRWVLGEQSYSLLRGKKTEDMIFTGSELRPRAGMASATITFDNTDNWLPIEFNEVAVTRRAYRDGQNEYLINGQRVRLKDVSELLAQSGLAERTYTIIGQGLVDTALAIRPEERRRLFEEAAGIGLYRSRKEESLRRLEMTRRNLERVQDILAELQPRLKSLERQARRVQEYEQIKADLKILLRDWYGYHWHRAQLEVSEAREVLRIQEQGLAKARQDQVDITDQLLKIRNRIREIRNVLLSHYEDFSQLRKENEEIKKKIAVIGEREIMLLELETRSRKEIIRVEEELELSADRLSASLLEFKQIETEYQEAVNDRTAALNALAEQQSKRTLVEKEVQSVTQELLSLKNQQFQTKTWITNRTNQIHGLTITQENIEKGLLKNREELSSLQAQIKKADEVLIKHKEQLLRAESEFQLHRTKQNKVQENRRKALEEQGSTAALLARLEAEKKVLIQAESQLAGYASGTKEIFNAARKSSWLNIRGAVSQFLQVPKELEVAIASVLGDFSDAVVLESYSDEVLDLLKEKDQKGSIIPLRNIRLSSASNEFKRMEGVVGFASELCQVPEELVAVKNLLLSGVIIVEDRQAARRVMAEIGNHAKMNISQVVTLQGEIFYSTGAIKSSGRGMENKTVIGRTRQIKELEAAIQAEKDQVDAIKKEIARLEEEEQKLTLEADTIFQAVRLANKLVDDSTQVFNKVNQKYEILAQQISWQESQLEKTGLEIAQAQADLDQKVAELEAIEEKIVFTETKARENSSRLLELSLDEFQEDVSRWNTNVAVAAKAIEAVKTRIADLNSTIENQKALKATMENQLQQTSLSLEAIKAEKIVCIQVDAEIQQKIADLQSKIEPEETEINHLEKKLEELEEKELIARQSFTVLESHASQARSGFARRQESLDSLRHRIEEDFGLVNFEYTGDMSGPTPLPLEGMVEKLPNIKQLSPEIEEAIKRQRAQLRRIGLVNPEVLEEYNEVQGRFNFLTEQVADLEKADFDIRKVIQDLDLLMQNEFRQVFDQVAVVFREYFSRLFGGGSARLILTDPEDLTETGVEIEARLPGRRMQGLSLLSGGERSLTAVALVFALLKVSPTPFCLLDEVDAMLDEANVHRFRELLKELSQNTQFVIVTHNRNTVQVADYIFGVTLGRDLASQVLSLRLDEISKVVGEEV